MPTPDTNPASPINRCARCEAEDPAAYDARQDVTILEDGDRFCMACEAQWSAADTLQALAERVIACPRCKGEGIVCWTDLTPCPVCG